MAIALSLKAGRGNPGKTDLTTRQKCFHTTALASYTFPITKNTAPRPCEAASGVRPVFPQPRWGRVLCVGIVRGTAVGRNSLNGAYEMVNLEKWKRATIHLEGVADLHSIHEHFAEARSLLFEPDGRIHTGEDVDQIRHQLDAKYLSGFHAVRYNGSAIFLRHNELHYLLTARHVLHNELEARAYLDIELNQAARRYAGEA